MALTDEVLFQAVDDLIQLLHTMGSVLQVGLHRGQVIMEQAAGQRKVIEEVAVDDLLRVEEERDDVACWLVEHVGERRDCEGPLRRLGRLGGGQLCSDRPVWSNSPSV